MNAPEYRFFLTAEDPRELPKGSRDPLRFIPVWAAAGRKMIPYLTTVTPSYRGFLTRFLFHGALELYESPLSKASNDDQWEAFCRFEQLCAIVRTNCEHKTPWLPGSTSVPGRLREDSSFVVGTQTAYWLGKSQKTTGFWGYYHQACQGARILQLNKADRPGYVLTEAAMEAFQTSSAHSLMTRLRPHLEPILSKKTVELTLQPFAELAAYFHQHSDLRDFWSEHLLMPDTATTRGAAQRAFADCVKAKLNDDPNSAPYQIWESLCSDERPDAVTAHALQVRATEAVIGLSEWVFDVCRLRGEEQPTLHLARDWALRNGFGSEWLDRLKPLEEPRDSELQEIRHIALGGNQDSFIPLASALLARHKRIMQGRGGAPWVSADDEGNLTIREPAEEPKTPNLNDFPSGVRWRYDYFLRSWLTAAREIGFVPEVTQGV